MTLKLSDFQLGRIQFPTAETAFQEALGDALDAVGAGLAAGERKPRPFALTLPVRASDREANPYTEGNRMRRQVRSLMDNVAARMGGLYMKVAFDSELNGWLLIGGGQLEYGNEAAVVFADYKLTLSDSYLAGQLRSHRLAKRIEVLDRRLSTTPRDYERIIYSTSFAATPLVAEVALPHGATDLRARSSASVSSAAAVATADGGTVIPVKGLVQGDVLSFEQPEAKQNYGDVVIYDRRGNKTPTETNRINLLRNPSAEVNGTFFNLGKVEWAEGLLEREAKPSGFASGSGEYAMHLTGKKDATSTQRNLSVAQSTALGTVTPGSKYSFGATVYIIDNINLGFQVRIDWYDASSTFISSSAVSPFFVPATGPAEARLSIANQTAPANASFASAVLIGFSAVNGDTVNLWTDSWLFEKAAVAEEYFDGDSAWAHWTGAAGGSTSELMPEPQVNFGWEEVYGPNYPLSEGDVPVLSNGLCRIRYLTAPLPCFAWDEFSGGVWVERYRFTPAVGTEGWVTGLTYVTVKEWTPDRAVIFARFAGPIGLPPIDMYMTLARGWGGPRLEAYVRPGGYSTEYTSRFYLAPATNTGSVFAYSAKAHDSLALGWNSTYSYLSTDEPWGVVSMIEGTFPRLSLSLADVYAIILTENNKLWGAGRRGFAVRGSATGGATEAQKLATGYVGVDLQLGGETIKLVEAETIRQASSPTTSEVEDAAASGSKAVNDTQVAETNPTLQATLATLGLTSGASYFVFARVKVVTSGTLKARMGFGGPTGEVKESTSTTFVWIPMGRLAASSTWQFDLWRTTAGSARVDRLIFVPDSNSTFDGARDLASASLADAHMFNELVAR